MQSPEKIVLPFADDGDKNSIPINSQIGVVDGAPSYETGWPPLTMIPIEEGGIPPVGPDFNGILNVLTAIARWNVAGGTYHFDANFAASPHTEGYPLGAIVRKASNNGLWVCVQQNNTTNPDTGGAGWMDFFAWINPTAYGGKIYVNANLNVTAGDYLVDTTAGSFILTLPATPALGAAITFTDANATWGKNAFTLARNGKTIMTQSADLLVNVSDQEFTIWYNGTDWRLV